MAQSSAPSLLLRLCAAGRRAAFSSGRTGGAQRSFAQAAELRKSNAVPDGHLNSDLSPTACHIGLGRRRDLTLRQDLCLWQGDKKLSLADVFKASAAAERRPPASRSCAGQS
jgi:hypothetical protein